MLKKLFVLVTMLIVGNMTHAAQIYAITPPDPAGVGINFCLEVQNGTYTNGTPVVINRCAEPASQRQSWFLDKQGRVHFKYAQMCLDVPGNNANSGNLLQIFSCHTGPNQRWTLKKRSAT